MRNHYKVNISNDKVELDEKIRITTFNKWLQSTNIQLILSPWLVVLDVGWVEMLKSGVFFNHTRLYIEFLKIFGAGLHIVTVAIAHKILIDQRQYF